MVLAWNAAARREHAGPSAVVFARRSTIVLISATVLVICALIPAFVTLDDNSAPRIILLALFGAVFYVGYLPTALLFWAANDTSLTRQWLTFEKTLPWYSIDRVYSQCKQTNNRYYSFKAGRQQSSSSLWKQGRDARFGSL